MDVNRSDALVRTVLRRRLFGAFSSVAIALGPLTQLTEAKGKHRHRRPGHHNSSHCPACPDCATCPDDVVCPPPPPPAPACAEVCGSCTLCYHRGIDTLLCSSDTRFIAGCDDPASACTSDNDCLGTDRPYCITHIQPRGSTERFDICGTPGGHCTVIFDPCSGG